MSMKDTFPAAPPDTGTPPAEQPVAPARGWGWMALALACFTLLSWPFLDATTTGGAFPWLRAVVLAGPAPGTSPLPSGALPYHLPVYLPVHAFCHILMLDRADGVSNAYAVTACLVSFLLATLTFILLARKLRQNGVNPFAATAVSLGLLLGTPLLTAAWFDPAGPGAVLALLAVILALECGRRDPSWPVMHAAYFALLTIDPRAIALAFLFPPREVDKGAEGVRRPGPTIVLAGGLAVAVLMILPQLSFHHWATGRWLPANPLPFFLGVNDEPVTSVTAIPILLPALAGLVMGMLAGKEEARRWLLVLGGIAVTEVPRVMVHGPGIREATVLAVLPGLALGLAELGRRSRGPVARALVILTLLAAMLSGLETQVAHHLSGAGPDAPSAAAPRGTLAEHLEALDPRVTHPGHQPLIWMAVTRAATSSPRAAMVILILVTLLWALPLASLVSARSGSMIRLAALCLPPAILLAILPAPPRRASTIAVLPGQSLNALAPYADWNLPPGTTADQVRIVADMLGGGALPYGEPVALVEIQHSRGLVERRSLRAGLEILDAEVRRLNLTTSRIPAGMWVDRYELDALSPTNALARSGFYPRPWVTSTWTLDAPVPLERITVTLLEPRVRVAIDRLDIERTRERPGR